MGKKKKAAPKKGEQFTISSPFDDFVVHKAKGLAFEPSQSFILNFLQTGSASSSIFKSTLEHLLSPRDLISFALTSKTIYNIILSFFHNGKSSSIKPWRTFVEKCSKLSENFACPVLSSYCIEGRYQNAVTHMKHCKYSHIPSSAYIIVDPMSKQDQIYFDTYQKQFVTFTPHIILGDKLLKSGDYAFNSHSVRRGNLEAWKVFPEFYDFKNPLFLSNLKTLVASMRKPPSQNYNWIQLWIALLRDCGITMRDLIDFYVPLEIEKERFVQYLFDLAIQEGNSEIKVLFVGIFNHFFENDKSSQRKTTLFNEYFGSSFNPIYYAPEKCPDWLMSVYEQLRNDVFFEAAISSCLFESLQCGYLFAYVEFHRRILEKYPNVNIEYSIGPSVQIRDPKTLLDIESLMTKYPQRYKVQYRTLNAESTQCTDSFWEKLVNEQGDKIPTIAMFFKPTTMNVFIRKIKGIYHYSDIVTTLTNVQAALNIVMKEVLPQPCLCLNFMDVHLCGRNITDEEMQFIWNKHV